MMLFSKPLTILPKRSISDVWKAPKYVSEDLLQESIYEIKQSTMNRVQFVEDNLESEMEVIWSA